MELYIIRHGQSMNNALSDGSPRFPDAPLTDLGKTQAEYLAQHLATADNLDPEITNPNTGNTTQREGKGSGITHLYCSAMRRAMQTAQPAGQALGIHPEVWVDIHEHGGICLSRNGSTLCYPGLNRTEIAQLFPNYTIPEEVTERGWWLHNDAEDMVGCWQRAQRVAKRLWAWAASPDGDTRRVGMVTHGTFTTVLLKTLLQAPIDNHVFFWHYNTGITRVDLFGGGLAILRYVNRVSHLTPKLIT